MENFVKAGLLPSVKLAQAQDVLPLAQALQKAGVPFLELVYNAEAEHAFALLAAERPDFTAGACVRTPEEAAAAQKAGAKFITDDCTAVETGFPGGRVVLEEELLSKRDWAEVTCRVSSVLLKFLDFNLRHVGINSKDEAESSATSSSFERIFGFPKEDRGGAYFAGDIIEVMKKPFYGRHGHIAISTADAASAARYLESCGVKLNWASAGYNPDGRLRVVYLQDEIGGFAVHILQK